MKRFFSILVLVLLVSLQLRAEQRFQLIFSNTEDLDFEYELYELPIIFRDKVGTNGNIDQIAQLTPKSKLVDGKFDLTDNQIKYIGLVVKSKKKRAIDFFVAPHSTNQPKYDLDFKFNCLCYHHVYKLEKGKLWYRVMRLTNLKAAGKNSKLIVLKHEFIPWRGESFPKSSGAKDHSH